MSAASIITESMEAAAQKIEAGVADPVRSGMTLVAQQAQIASGRLGSVEAGREEGRQALKAAAIRGHTNDSEAEAAFLFAGNQAIEASGGDITWAEVKRSLQQSGPLKYSLTPQGLQDMILGRDEGGRAATAEQRMFARDVYRSTLSDEKKARQIEAGLRDSQGRALYANEALETPVQFVLDRILPSLQKLGIDLDNNAAVIQALENDIGFTESGSREAARVISQRHQIEAERRRALAMNPSAYLETPSVRMQAEAVKAQYENLAAQMMEGFLPFVNNALQEGQQSLSNFSRGEAGASDYFKLAEAAVPLGIGAAVMALGDESSRPLAAAGLALTLSAKSLTGAAVALTGAAGAQAIAGTAPSSGAAKKIPWWAKAAFLVPTVAAAWEARPWSEENGGWTGQTAEVRAFKEKTGYRTLFDRVGDWFLDTPDDNLGHSVRTWERPEDMVTANVADSMVMQAPDWGEAMADSMDTKLITTADSMADRIAARIKEALSTPIQFAVTANEASIAVTKPDTGFSGSGD